MKLAKDWKEYKIIATGDGEKLESWGNVKLLRPDPQVIWKTDVDMENYPSLNAKYCRSDKGGGKWNIKKRFPDEWTVCYGELKFLIKPACPPLEFLGRHSLIIYMVHQPIIYGLLYLIF